MVSPKKSWNHCSQCSRGWSHIVCAENTLVAPLPPAFQSPTTASSCPNPEGRQLCGSLRCNLLGSGSLRRRAELSKDEEWIWIYGAGVKDQNEDFHPLINMHTKWAPAMSQTILTGAHINNAISPKEVKMSWKGQICKHIITTLHVRSGKIHENSVEGVTVWERYLLYSKYALLIPSGNMLKWYISGWKHRLCILIAEISSLNNA